MITLMTRASEPSVLAPPMKAMATAETAPRYSAQKLQNYWPHKFEPFDFDGISCHVYPRGTGGGFYSALLPEKRLTEFDILASAKKVSSKVKVFSSKSAQLKTKILSWKNLKEDWDGYGGVRPRTSTIIDTLDFISTLSDMDIILPKPMLSGGGEIGLYWEDGARFLDIEFEGEGLLSYYARGFNGSPFGEDDIAFKDGLTANLEGALQLLSS